jgi:hypothetical protein
MWYTAKIINYFRLRQAFLSEMYKDIAQIFFGILAVESFTKNSIRWGLVATGLLLALIFWIAGIISFKIK